MNTNHLSFASFDDLMLAYENNIMIDYAMFTRQINDTPCEQGESRRIIFSAHDGNDYVITDAGSGDSFWLIAVSVPVAPFTTCDVLHFEEFSTLRQAVEHIAYMSSTDLGENDD